VLLQDDQWALKGRRASEALLGRPVDLVEREALEASRNYIRRRSILAEDEPIYRP
jgi:hypothetical protein